MSVDVEIRLGMLLVSLIISALAALASALGLALGFPDEIGGTVHG